MWELTIACKKRRVMSSKGNLEKERQKCGVEGWWPPKKIVTFISFRIKDVLVKKTTTCSTEIVNTNFVYVTTLTCNPKVLVDTLLLILKIVSSQHASVINLSTNILK